MTMIMQNVKAIKIAEGDVKTIEDKDKRLIWGKLNYDTKYEGDTFQHTANGKNLFNPTNLYHGYYKSNDPTQFISNEAYRTAVIDNLPTGTYTFSTDLPNCFFIRYIINNTITPYQVATNTVSITITGPATFKICFRNTSTSTITQDPNCQMERGSTATPYVPYDGGIPAPTPANPQNIQVVTGNQVVTLNDGTSVHDYNINLGSIELCKIGDYQDYIWKDGADWKVHKAVGKVVLDGSETWSEQWTGRKTYSTSVTNPVRTVDANTVASLKSYYYTAVTVNDLYAQRVDYGASIAIDSNSLLLRNKDCADSTAFTTWLSIYNTSVYYALAIATDTAITDATLIGQLNNIEQFMIRCGYSSTVSAVSPNLPIIIDRTEISNE